jgi:hypothetical protein
VSHPAAFLRDTTRMLEDGVLVRIQAGQPETRRSIPRSPCRQTAHASSIASTGLRTRRSARICAGRSQRGTALPDSFKDALVVAHRQVFKEKLRFVYDASTPTALALHGQSSAGIWRLHIQDDVANTGMGRAVVSKQDFKRWPET